MCRRLLILWLIVSLLGYGVVWAFDGHAPDLTDHAHVAGFTTQQLDGDIDNSSCDHCCHASAHMIGLASGRLSVAPTSPVGAVPPYSSSLISVLIIPPTKPPRA